jgi:hypothetical protein
MRSCSLVVAGVFVFLLSFGYTLPLAADLLDDHFMHVAWGRQLLAGRLPLRDMVEPGLPLQAALSAAGEVAFGYRLLSEGMIVATTFAAGALLTFLLATRAAGSLWIGLLMAIFQIAISPRTYSYPKILVYAGGIALLWAYIDRPTRARTAALAATVAVAFFLRHDHGLYLGLITVVMMGLRHAHEWRVGCRRVALMATVCVAAVAPYLAYVHAYAGMEAYVRDLRAFADREYQQNRFERWPRWPIASFGDLASWNADGPTTATIGIRWSADATDESRREAAARHRLQVPDDRPVDSGRYLLTDISPENGLALVTNAAVEDTSGLDRATGAVAVRGFWLGPLHVLPRLDSAEAAAGVLFFTYLAIVVLAMLAVARRLPERGLLGEWERLKMAGVVLVALVTGTAFLREPLPVRVGDAIVAPLVLAAWCAGRWVIGRHAGMRIWSRAGRTAAALLILLPVARSVAVVGAVPSRLEGAGRLAGAAPPSSWTSTWQRLSASPPFDAEDEAGGARERVIRYVRACTAPREPLLVLWFAPQLYYYADRPFAGRLGFYMEGYWTSEEHERMNLARIERDRPVLAISEIGHEATDLHTYPALIAYLARYYSPIGELPDNDASVIRVLARKDRSPTSTDTRLGWPCYR